MKKLILGFIAIGLLFSCGNQPQIETYNIKGKVPEADGKKVVLYKINKELVSVPMDTIEVVDSVFNFVVPKQNPDLGVIKFVDEPQKRLAVVLGENDVEIIVKDQYGFNADVSRSQSQLTKKMYDFFKKTLKENEEGKAMMKEYRKAEDAQTRDSIKKVFEEWASEIKDYQNKYIEENKDITGLVVMQTLASTPDAKFGKLYKVYSQYPPAVKQTGMGKYLNVLLLTKGTTDIGGKAPNFIAPTPDGKRLSLNQAMGKVTLIDFWASWCRPCRVENPYVVSLYRKYHDRGFNIIGVSLDKNKEDWIHAIKKDSLEWQHVSNLKFWQEPIAKLYGVSAIPQTFLLNSKGEIVAKNLRREELEKKIVELLDN